MINRILPAIFCCFTFVACATRPGLKPAQDDPRYIGLPADAARRDHKDTFTFKELDTPLRQLKFVNPRYPGHLLAKGKTGSALVAFTITETGDVTDVEVLQATHPDFGVSAASAISQWKFSIPFRHGHPVRVRLAQELPFVLR